MLSKFEKWVQVSPKILILLTIFLDVLGIGLIIPVLPHYVEIFDLPDIVVAGLFAAFSIFAFFSAPIMGMISDKKGRRPVLLVSLFTTAVGWIIFAYSRNIFGLFVGRIVDGLAAGNISTAQNYLIDISHTREERTKNLGLIGAISGLGIIGGPLIGSILFAINHRLPFITVGVIAFISTILAYFFLPETVHVKTKEKLSLNPFAPIIRGFRNKKMAPLYWAWLLVTITIAMSQTIFALYVSQMFAWGVIIAGILVTVSGLIFALNQTLFLDRFWFKRYEEPWLLLWMLVPFSIGYFIMGLPWGLAFIFGIILNALGYSILRMVINNEMLDHVEPDKQGEMMGILSSLIALAMIIGPVLGGPAYEILPSLPFILSGFIVIATFIIIYRNRGKLFPVR